MKMLARWVLAWPCVGAIGAYRPGLRDHDRDSDSSECDKTVVLDVMLALDNTKSMAPYIEGLAAQYSAVVSDLNDAFPGSRFGLATFNEISSNCTETTSWKMHYNYCNRLELSLGSPIADIQRVLKESVSTTSRYGDLYKPEDSLGVMAQQSNNPAASWRSGVGGGLLKKVMIVLTDASYRYPGDYDLSKTCHDIPPNDGTAEYKCGQEQFYTPYQAAALIKQSGVMPIVVTLQEKIDRYNTFFESNGIQGYTAVMDETDTTQLAEIIRSAVGDIACHEPPPPTPTLQPSSTRSTEATTGPSTFSTSVQLTATTATQSTMLMTSTENSRSTITQSTVPVNSTKGASQSTTESTMLVTSTEENSQSTAESTMLVTSTEENSQSATELPTESVTSTEEDFQSVTFPVTPTNPTTQSIATVSLCPTSLNPTSTLPASAAGSGPSPSQLSNGKKAAIAVGAAAGGVGAIGGLWAYRRASAPTTPLMSFTFEPEAQETSADVERDVQANADISDFS